MWWFFALIVSQTYIAQLSASLTSASQAQSFKDVEGLATQTKVQYGMIESGSTRKFFETSQVKMYRQMWSTMSQARPSVMTRTNSEGANRVLSAKGNYAFFMESTTIDYLVKRDCRLTSVGSPLDSKDYGIAMPANSPFRSEINQAILHMKQTGALNDIKKKWWDEKDGAKSCDTAGEKEDDDTSDLEMKSLLGVFIVLGFGCFMAIIITAIEFLDHIRRIVIDQNFQVSYKEALTSELKSSLNFTQLQKPILKTESPTPSEHSNLFEPERMTFAQTAAAAFMETEKMF